MSGIISIASIFCTFLTSDYHLQCALLANSAGIGGGPFYVPLLNVVLGFDLKAATGLSHTIVGAHCQFAIALHSRYLTVHGPNMACGRVSNHSM